MLVSKIDNKDFENDSLFVRRARRPLHIYDRNQEKQNITRLFHGAACIYVTVSGLKCNWDGAKILGAYEKVRFEDKNVLLRSSDIKFRSTCSKSNSGGSGVDSKIELNGKFTEKKYIVIPKYGVENW